MVAFMKVCTVSLVLAAIIGAASAETLTLSKKLWISTGPGNSLVVNPALFQFNGRTIRTSSEETNIHSHYKVPAWSALRNYTFTGEMYLADAGGGIGVTFHSQYRKSDTYYRLRRTPFDQTFHIAPHPDGVQTITEGTTDSGVSPSAGVWYRFKILVKTTAARTRIRAKVWARGAKEPKGWQIDCSDTSSIRIKRGRIGVWSMAAGEKRWGKLVVN